MMLWSLLGALAVMGVLMGAIAFAALQIDRAIEKAKRGSDDLDR